MQHLSPNEWRHVLGWLVFSPFLFVWFFKLEYTELVCHWVTVIQKLFSRLPEGDSNSFFRCFCLLFSFLLCFNKIWIHHSLRPVITYFQSSPCVIWQISVFSPRFPSFRMALTATLSLRSFLMRPQQRTGGINKRAPSPVSGLWSFSYFRGT